jgi:hypothetical protein
MCQYEIKIVYSKKVGWRIFAVTTENNILFEYNDKLDQLRANNNWLNLISVKEAQEIINKIREIWFSRNLTFTFSKDKI